MTQVFSQAILLAILAVFGSQAALGQVADEAAEKKFCGHAKEIRDTLIKEATETPFTTRRVEISGNTYTRDRDFRQRMVAGMNEGDIFTLTALEKTLKRISKMKSIYPITMDNIEVRTNREYKEIHIVFCVEQRERKK